MRHPSMCKLEDIFWCPAKVHALSSLHTALIYNVSQDHAPVLFAENGQVILLHSEPLHRCMLPTVQPALHQRCHAHCLACYSR